ncbi:Arylsulfatase [Pirellulimonas nuda]|uniref:Arylsulfatase n=1 Tax=Pirellulimonas nuda TaxID=2528009 RepID=A0A518D983_9BACT|nr:arylsulfatase [Pirellulimonas nuda]QDU88024.1 Arylsulfatase [Pirellulimonas nuda]
MKTNLVLVILAAVCGALASQRARGAESEPPNIVIVYTDDVGIGDVSCYGSSAIHTPNIDRLAADGLRFTSGYASSATCTPSRYSLLTGSYAFRNPLAEILPADAPMLIEPGSATLPELLRRAGYATAVIGKWHLGLGRGGVDWNGDIKPGPLEAGFDESYVMAATNDRVPCVYIDGRRVEGAEQDDPIQIDYRKKIGTIPTGHERPDLTRLAADPQHSGTIINGISRIGYMSGGRAAWWKDEEMADRFTDRAIRYVTEHKDKPFFLYFNLHDIHEPRWPADRHRGKSGAGGRGDAILEMDEAVGRFIDALERLDLRKNTLVIFSSDNGPVVTDGYEDGSLENIGDHDPNGPFRGGKYQVWEGGTRMPTIVSWPGTVKPGVTDAMVCQVDFLASLAELAGASVPEGAGPDSVNVLPALLGRSDKGRDELVQQGNGRMAIRKADWKYIPAGPRKLPAGPKHGGVGDPTGHSDMPAEAQLYNLADDPGESTNVIAQHPVVANDLAARLKQSLQSPTVPSK